MTIKFVKKNSVQEFKQVSAKLNEHSCGIVSIVILTKLNGKLTELLPVPVTWFWSLSSFAKPIFVDGKDGSQNQEKITKKKLP